MPGKIMCFSDSILPFLAAMVALKAATKLGWVRYSTILIISLLISLAYGEQQEQVELFYFQIKYFEVEIFFLRENYLIFLDKFGGR
jgi:hypothetical protein